MSLAETLKRVTEINNFNEINNIVMEINNSKFDTYKDLLKKLKVLIDEFDPIDRAETTSQILSMIRPDIRALLDPVNVITAFSNQKPKRRFLCL